MRHMGATNMNLDEWFHSLNVLCGDELKIAMPKVNLIMNKIILVEIIIKITVVKIFKTVDQF